MSGEARKDTGGEGAVSDGADERMTMTGSEVVEGGSGGTIEVGGAAGKSARGSLIEELDDQDRQAQRYAMDFLLKIIRLRGVKIDRAEFLRQELGRAGASDEVIASAVGATPVQAGMAIKDLDAIAQRSIVFESKKAAAISFATGIPGGLALFATVPADVTQYYVHAFRVMQKLAYIYGWQDLLGDLDDADDDTIGRLALLLAVMLGVGGAAGSLTVFANQIVRPAVQKQISSKALTKTAWYPVVKQTLRVVGIRVTKGSLARTVTKVVPVAGGLLSGGMTLVALKAQAIRLQRHLRELPPPGADAAAYLADLRSSGARQSD
ncbi:hypothetical protein J5X07_09095 [Actinomyces bowdenii]|uniref:hypothetical protein n=1 Tax=Actinomyces bowdenii TaxID=131109 RepID=UPI001ABC7D8A|nr:hypothetical protein [Actinomyces bowdenii]MBO3725179.1 hypothetical protein [Actinomyces bowdenii]